MCFVQELSARRQGGSAIAGVSPVWQTQQNQREGLEATVRHGQTETEVRRQLRASAITLGLEQAGGFTPRP